MISKLPFNKTFSIPIDVYNDNRSLYNILNLTNGLWLDIAMIEENVLNNQVTIHWLITTEQIANVLTKDSVSSEILLKHLNTNKLLTYNQISSFICFLYD